MKRFIALSARPAASLAVLVVLSAWAAAAGPATKRGAKPPPRAQAVAPAEPEQVQAAERVYQGRYECELHQTIVVAVNRRHAGYIDVKHGKATYLMKPVVSATGAVRLEDVKGRVLMVQIDAKSMLLDTKAGRRLVDECVSPGQRTASDAAKRQAAGGGTGEMLMASDADTPGPAGGASAAAGAATASSAPRGETSVSAAQRSASAAAAPLEPASGAAVPLLGVPQAASAPPWAPVPHVAPAVPLVPAPEPPVAPLPQADPPASAPEAPSAPR